MIGNRGYAMYIREWVREEQRVQGYSYDAPRYAPSGWKYLGQGCYRAAYLSPDGVAYKVQHYSNSGQTNIAEYRRWWALRLEHRMPEGSRLPALSFFKVDSERDGVTAMEHFEKTLNRYSGDDYYRYSDTLHVVSRRLRLWDMHHGNAAVDEKNGLIVPIDLG